MPRWTRWTLALALGPLPLFPGADPGSAAQSLAHSENVVVSPDGQLEALSFGRRACVRVMHEARLLADLTCVDLAQPGEGVLRLVVDGRPLEVPYRAELSLGRTDYLIRLGAGWGAGSASSPGCTANACLVRGALPLPVLPEATSHGGTTPPTLPRAVPSVALEPLPLRQPAASTPDDPVHREATLVGERGPASGRELPADPAALAYARFTLRQGERGAQLSYALLARAPLETPTAALRLYLDGQPLKARLTRRGLGPVPGRLEAGDGEWGWLELGRLQGAVLRLEWALAGGVLRREWRLR